MKLKALQDDNYSQLDNFIEYENYIGNSYFTQFLFEFVEKVKNQLN